MKENSLSDELDNFIRELWLTVDIDESMGLMALGASSIQMMKIAAWIMSNYNLEIPPSILIYSSLSEIKEWLRAESCK